MSNLAERLLNAGFEIVEERLFHNYEYKLNGGWYGCSTYHPDHRFVKDNVIVDFSLQGPTSAIYSTGVNDYKDYKELWDNRAIRLIGVKIDNNIVYKSFTGVEPCEDLINTIIHE